jgi:hypothetical protein
MSDTSTTDLLLGDLRPILRAYPEPVAELTRQAAVALVELRPDLEAKVRLGWGSVNYRHPAAGFVCAIFPLEDHVSLVFEHGRQLSSPLLEGDGKQVRFIRLVPGAALPIDEIGLLLAEAIALRA